MIFFTVRVVPGEARVTEAQRRRIINGESIQRRWQFLPLFDLHGNINKERKCAVFGNNHKIVCKGGEYSPFKDPRMSNEWI